MADTFIQVATDGSGKKLDTRTEGTNSEHRQVVVIGDGATNANIAPVDVTKGLAVDLTATGANTTALKVNVASGGIASGGIASGAVASGAMASGAYAAGSIGSGAIASGAVASGAVASGALAAGAGTDGWNATMGAKADAKSTATDTTAVSLISIAKQISSSAQSLVSNSTSLGAAASSASVPVVPANDYGMSFSTVSLFNGTTALTPTKVKINVASATTTTLVALVAAKKIRILSMYLVSTGANTINFQSHTTTANSDGLMGFAANGGMVLPFNPIGWFDTTAGEALDMVTSGAGQVSGQLVYVAV